MWQRFVGYTLGFIVLVFVVSASSAVAHEGHDHGDGRIPGQPDFHRFGKAEFKFHPKAHAYTYKRGPNAPALWFHVDDIAESRASETPLPTTEEPIVCTSTGHRIRIFFSSSESSTPTAPQAEQIRSAVRRMASKLLSESLRSSANARGLRMAVECDESGEIRIQGFKSTGNVEEVFGWVDSLFGTPIGANAAKTMVFFAGADPSGKAAGYGAAADDDDKSSSDEFGFGKTFNENRIYPASAVVYGSYWTRATSLHELFHTLGAVQDGAPATTGAFHCYDGYDVLCYDDGSFLGALYSETACPATSGFATAIGIPLDCGYDSYFDALEESGEYLNSHWNVGGTEDPYLLTSPTVEAPSVGTPSVSSLTKTGVTFNASIKPNGLPTEYRFEYGLTTAYGTRAPNPNATLGSNLFSTQSVAQPGGGLLPKTTYHYRLAAFNAKGTTYSSDQTFTTPVSWNIVTTPNGSGAEHSNLFDIACDPASTNACTAVGKQVASGGTSSPYAQYWNGTSWVNQTAATPVGATAAELQADTCVSKTSCVAAGSYMTASGTFSLAEAWNGSSWSVQTTPNPAGATETRLKGVSCKELTACIAVGYSGSGSSSQPVAIRGNAGTWSLQSVPLPSGAVGAELTGVDCTSTTSCRAVGRYYPSASTSTYWGMAATWNGTSWTSEAVTKPTGEPKRSTLLDISCASGSSCAAVGGYTNSSGTQVSYVERWNGTSWSWQSSPNPAGSTNSPLQSVSCVESAPCVAVGDWLDSSAVWRPVAQLWNGSSWEIETIEVPAGQTFGVFEGVACASRCIAAGWYTASGKDKTLVELR
ncbi:MAG: hypothetical protein ABW065_07115 [Solirubrobacterales bacterium]